MDLVRIPANLFHAFVMSSPATSVTNKPFNISPRPVGLAVMAIPHHQHHAGLLNPHVARPVAFKSKGVVDVKEEMTAGPKCPSHCLCSHPQICPTGKMIQRIVFASNQIDAFRKTEAPHVLPKYAYRQPGATSLLTDTLAHHWGYVHGVRRDSRARQGQGCRSCATG